MLLAGMAGVVVCKVGVAVVVGRAELVGRVHLVEVVQMIPQVADFETRYLT